MSHESSLSLFYNFTFASKLVFSPNELMSPLRTSFRYNGIIICLFTSFIFFFTEPETYKVTGYYSYFYIKFPLLIPAPSNFKLHKPYAVSLG